MSQIRGWFPNYLIIGKIFTLNATIKTLFGAFLLLISSYNKGKWSKNRGNIPSCFKLGDK